MDYTSLLLPDVIAEAEAIAADAERTFAALSPEQLNWKPDASQWSVGQCLDHLIQTDSRIGAALDGVITDTKPSRFAERIPGLPGFFGRLMVKSLGPQVTRKMKAPAAATPAASDVPADVVIRFLANHDQTIERMRALESKHPERAIITSPFAGVVVYSALDACRIVVAHDRRHMAQAERVMGLPEFPR